jgi:hypothetical protein
MPEYEPRLADPATSASGHAAPQAARRPNRRRRAAARSPRSASGRARAGQMERWQLVASFVRIAIELLEPFLDHLYGGPGRLL